MARGSIIKRGNSWRISVELPPDPVTGKRRRLFETVPGLKRDAEARLVQLLSEANQNRLEPSPKSTLGQYLDRWLQDYGAGRAHKTYSRYDQIIRNQAKPHLGGVRLDRLTLSHFVRLLATLRDADRLDGRGKLSAQTVLHTYRMLHTALECARKWHLIGTNPLDSVEPPKVARAEMRTFTVEQGQAFLVASATEGPKWQSFFTLALTTGLRLGELKGLRWQDVDLDTATVRVQQAVQRVNGLGRVTRQPKTAGGRRPIALSSDVVSLLRRYRIVQNEERLSMGPLWHDLGLVFASQVGTPLEDKRIREVFFRICYRAGVPQDSPLRSAPLLR